MTKLYRLHLYKLTRETPGAVTLHFKQPGFERIWYKAGQHLVFRVQIEGRYHYRTYSLCTAPRIDSDLAVTVKRLPGGLVSNWINDTAREDTWWEVAPPRGGFFVENSVKNHRDLVFFAAGSGITPIMSMLRSTLYNEPRSRVALFYANRRVEDIIYRQWLEEEQAKFTDRLQVFHILSRQQDPVDFEYLPGRLTANRIPELIGRISGDLPRTFYLCGPVGFMEAAWKGLEAEGVSSHDIFQESFFEPTETLFEDVPSREVTLKMGGKTHQFVVPGGMSILEAGLNLGLELPYSCRRGICSSCIGTLKRGEVSLKNEEALLDFERAQGRVLMCQAQPLDDQVEIEVGF